MAATAQQILDAINDAMLAAALTGGVTRYKIGDTEKEWNLAELRKMRSEIQAEVSSAAGSTRNYASF